MIQFLPDPNPLYSEVFVYSETLMSLMPNQEDRLVLGDLKYKLRVP